MNITKLFCILCIILMSAVLLATGSELDKAPLLKAQKVGGDYTYPIAMGPQNDNFPKVYETKKFTELRLFYFQNANQINPILENHLLMSDSKYHSEFSIVKYHLGQSIKVINGENGKAFTHQFSDREIWMYTHFPKISKLMIVYIDSGKDGFIYDCKDSDGEIDQVGVYYPEGLVIYTPKQFENLPLSDYRAITVDSKEYRANLIRGMRRLHRDGKEVIPFIGTEIKLLCGREVNNKKQVAYATELIAPKVTSGKVVANQYNDLFAFQMSSSQKEWWSVPVGSDQFFKNDFYADIMNQKPATDWKEDDKNVVQGRIIEFNEEEVQANSINYDDNPIYND